MPWWWYWLYKCMFPSPCNFFKFFLGFGLWSTKFLGNKISLQQQILITPGLTSISQFFDIVWIENHSIINIMTSLIIRKISRTWLVWTSVKKLYDRSIIIRGRNKRVACQTFTHTYVCTYTYVHMYTCTYVCAWKICSTLTSVLLISYRTAAILVGQLLH